MIIHTVVQVKSDMEGQKQKKEALTLRQAVCCHRRAGRFLLLALHVRRFFAVIPGKSYIQKSVVVGSANKHTGIASPHERIGLAGSGTQMG